MSLIIQEGVKMNENAIHKKDFSWNINDATYVIKNIPYETLDADGEVFIDYETSIKMDFIRELMITNQISNIVDFDLVKDYEINI